MRYSRTLLFIHPIYTSLHLLTQNSQSIPPQPPSSWQPQAWRASSFELCCVKSNISVSVFFSEFLLGLRGVLLFTGVKVRPDKHPESLTSYSPGLTKLKSISRIHARTLSASFRPVLLRNVLKQPQHSWSLPPGDKKEKWVAVNQKRLGHWFYPKNCLQIRHFCKLASTVGIQIDKMLATFRNMPSINLYSGLSHILRFMSCF